MPQLRAVILRDPLVLNSVGFHDAKEHRLNLPKIY